MKLLVVDDEIIALEGLKYITDWKMHGIENLYTAYNIIFAKEIIQKESVDILLCDIEMPLGSGIELLEWIQQQNYDIKTILLTCHSEFRYAQSALRLGCVDYLLKPVGEEELEKVIDRTVSIIKRERGNESEGKEIYFWTAVLKEEINTEELFLNKAEKLRLLDTIKEEFASVLIEIRYLPEGKKRDKEINCWINAAVLEDFQIFGKIVLTYLENGMFLLILSKGQIKEAIAITECAKRFADRYLHQYGTGICCYCGVFVKGWEVVELYEKQLILSSRNLLSHRIISVDDAADDIYYWREQKEKVWKVLLREKKYTTLYEEIRKELYRLGNSANADKIMLTRITRRIWELVSEVCQEEGIRLEEYMGKEDELLYQWQSCSVEHALDFYQSLFGLLKSKNRAKNLNESAVERVKEYISLNISQNLSRENLAKLVSMNPDYLTRLFRKETGQSLKGYIINERIAMAIELLDKTDMTVGEVGMRVGFSSFSYFATVFKKTMGIAPIIYRNRRQKKD